MALLSISLPPGVFANGTLYQSKGRYCLANLMRFSQDSVRPIGGWQKRSTTAPPFTGAARAVLTWRDNSNGRWVAVGTHSKLYAQDESGANHDITPVRRTVTLTAGSMATSADSAEVTVTDANHGARIGDVVTISGAIMVGAIPAAELNAAHVITDATTNTITFAVGDSADFTAAGGGTPTLIYQINGGRADADQNLGYGGGAFGSDYFGVPRPNTVAFRPATVWSLEAWGEDLVGCADTDGRIYLWSLTTAAPAAPAAGAPANCAGIVVTEEGFLFALGAGGDGRKVQWCDQQDITVWTADATNQAGDYDLPTAGTLQCGKAAPGGALCFTDVDVWRARYIGAPLVYGFERLGSGCGAISKGAVAVRDSLAVWMGKGPAFWMFDGQGVQALDCDVKDYVGDMNLNQVSKVTAVHLADFGEVWWFYPSGDSVECDRYVAWAYRESQRQGRNIWTVGELSRTAGTGRGVGANPLMVDPSGYLYEHETGLNYDGAQPFAETGPIEIGQGDRMAEIQRLIPDEMADGNLQATFYGRCWPDGPETMLGPITLRSPTDLLYQAREIRVRFSGLANAEWRIGAMRLEIAPGDPI